MGTVRPLRNSHVAASCERGLTSLKGRSVGAPQILRKNTTALPPPPRAAFMAPAAAPPSEADLGLGARVTAGTAARRAAAAMAPVAAGAKLGRAPRSSSLAPSPTPYLERVRVRVGGQVWVWVWSVGEPRQRSAWP